MEADPLRNGLSEQGREDTEDYYRTGLVPGGRTDFLVLSLRAF